MTKASVRIDVDWQREEVLAALKRMRRAGARPGPALASFAESWLNSTRERFKQQVSPSGTPWAALSDSYKKRKKRNQDKILILRGSLMEQLHPRSNEKEAVVYSPLVYAPTHQYGAAAGEYGSTSTGRPIPFGDIPARPFLGLSDDDRAEFVRTINRHIARARDGEDRVLDARAA